MSAAPLKVVKFETFTADFERNILTCDGASRTLRRQSFEVLRYLVERQGQAVAAENIISAVWKVAPASPDASLTQCIKDIRRALADDGAWMVRTISGVGYEFVPALSMMQSEQPLKQVVADHSEAPTAPGTAPQSASVLPPMASRWSIRDAQVPRGQPLVIIAAVFAAAMGGTVWLRAGEQMALPRPTEPSVLVHAVAPSQVAPLAMLAAPSVVVLPAVAAETTSGGQLSLVDEIATELQRTPRGYDLVIKPATNLRERNQAPEAVSRAIGVRYVVTTTVREQAGARQLIVQLIEGPTGRQIWAAPFALPAGSLEQQGIVAARIARSLVVQIRSAENLLPLPAQPEAGHYVLQGRALLESERGRDVNSRAMALFDKALALDPNSIQALLGSARTRVDSAAGGWAAEANWAAVLKDAAKAVDRVIALDKTSTGAHLLRGVIERTSGNFDAAIASLEHARDINPTYPFVHAELARTKVDAGKPAEAIAHIERALALSPTDPTSSFWCAIAGMAAAHIGDFEASRDWLLKARQINPSHHGYRPWLAISYARLGDLDRARSLVQEHLTDYRKFTVQSWIRIVSRGEPGAAARLKRFGEMLQELGVPNKS